MKAEPASMSLTEDSPSRPENLSRIQAFINSVSFLSNISNLFYFIVLPFFGWIGTTILTYQKFRDIAGYPGGLLLILSVVIMTMAAFGAVSFGIFQRNKRYKLGQILDDAQASLIVQERLLKQLTRVEEELLVRLTRSADQDPEADLHEILRTLAVCCEQVLAPNVDANCFSVGILRLNPATGKFFKLADSSYTGSSKHFEEISDLTYDNSSAGRALRTNEIVVVNNTGNRLEAGNGDWQYGNHEAICCSPVPVEDDVKYVVAVTSSKPDVFDSNNITICRRFGEKARTVIASLAKRREPEQLHLKEIEE